MPLGPPGAGAAPGGGSGTGSPGTVLMARRRRTGAEDRRRGGGGCRDSQPGTRGAGEPCWVAGGGAHHWCHCPCRNFMSGALFCVYVALNDLSIKICVFLKRHSLGVCSHHLLRPLVPRIAGGPVGLWGASQGPELRPPQGSPGPSGSAARSVGRWGSSLRGEKASAASRVPVSVGSTTANCRS